MSLESVNEDISVADITFDLERMFPAAAKRVDVLEGLKRYWAQIVGINYARYSRPYKLGVDELCIQVTKDQVESQLKKSKGSIMRAMANRFGYDAGENFRLTLTRNIPPVRKLQIITKKAPTDAK